MATYVVSLREIIYTLYIEEYVFKITRGLRRRHDSNNMAYRMDVHNWTLYGK